MRNQERLRKAGLGLCGTSKRRIVSSPDQRSGRDDSRYISGRQHFWAELAERRAATEPAERAAFEAQFIRVYYHEFNAADEAALMSNAPDTRSCVRDRINKTGRPFAGAVRDTATGERPHSRSSRTTTLV